MLPRELKILLKLFPPPKPPPHWRINSFSLTLVFATLRSSARILLRHHLAMPVTFVGGRKGAVHRCKDILLLVCSWDGAKQVFAFLIRDSPVCSEPLMPVREKFLLLCFAFLILIPMVLWNPFPPWLFLVVSSNKSRGLSGQGKLWRLWGPPPKSRRQRNLFLGNTVESFL